MQSILSGISTGVSTTGLRIVLGAQEKLGKTTLCAGAPNVLLVPLEIGFAGVSVHKTPMLATLEQVWSLLQETTYYAEQKQFPYKTLAFDSTTALEKLIHDYVLRQDKAYGVGNKNLVTMESAHGGYGKAYTLANEQFGVILGMLDVLAIQHGINIIMTSHVFASKVMDPTSGEYDSWDLLLHSPKNAKTYGKREMITQWADIIGFLYEPVFVNKAGNMSQATSQNKGRMLGVTRTPSYVAGNRFGIMGEIAIPAPPVNGWNALAAAIYTSTNKSVDIYTR